MMKQINKTNLGLVVAYLLIAIGTISGVLQEYIHFSGVLAEMAVLALSLFGAIAFSFGLKK